MVQYIIMPLSRPFLYRFTIVKVSHSLLQLKDGFKLGGFDQMFASSQLKQTILKDVLIMSLMMNGVR